jgi:putative transposase
MTRENPGWGYDRRVGALANLGYRLSAQTIGNILHRHSIAPAPKRKQTTSWKDFIRAHMDIMAATDFFTAEVFTLKGLILRAVRSPGQFAGQQMIAGSAGRQPLAVRVVG